WRQSRPRSMPVSWSLSTVHPHWRGFPFLRVGAGQPSLPWWRRLYSSRSKRHARTRRLRGPGSSSLTAIRGDYCNRNFSLDDTRPALRYSPVIAATARPNTPVCRSRPALFPEEERMSSPATVLDTPDVALVRDDADIAQATMRRVSLRLLPLLFAL